jgi:hypothetical protein
MDHLVEHFGEPPFRSEQIARLRTQATNLIATIASGSTYDGGVAVRMVDMLQELLNIICAGGLAHILPEFAESDDSCEEGDIHLPPDFEKLLGQLPVDLLVLKQEIFLRLDLPALHRPHPDGAAICHHCNWALERMGQMPQC